ncbi:hypothetical protein ACFL2G_04350 [Candidatus Omnitrophota bacterium]
MKSVLISILLGLSFSTLEDSPSMIPKSSRVSSFKTRFEIIEAKFKKESENIIIDGISLWDIYKKLIFDVEYVDELSGWELGS